MTHIHRHALLPYSCEQLFVLVNDVAAYPQYMAGCVGAEVLESTVDAMTARLDLARGPVKQSFTTCNRLQPFERIELTLVDGPFDDFAGYWSFQPLGETACKVTLDLHFALSSRIASLAAGKLFQSVANQLVDALSNRARQIHGR